MSFQYVRGYEEQLASFFDSTNDCGLALVSGRSNNFISSASRVAGESSLNSASCDYPFDVGENQIVVRHLLKEVWDCKLVVTIPHLLSDDINNSQSRSSRTY